MCLLVCLCTVSVKMPMEAVEEGAGTPGTGIICGCELHHLGAGN